MNLMGEVCFMFHDGDHWTNLEPYFVWCQRCHKVVIWRERIGTLERTVYGGRRDLRTDEKAVMARVASRT